jgi:26S proteasome regulatory subunit N11
MAMNNLQRVLADMQAQGRGPAADPPAVDTSEQIYISSLALLKMLKHGRAGVPMEVMGLMLGDFVDDYTVRVVDVFAMPQSGTGVSVEAVDPVFQTKMLDMLKQTGSLRPSTRTASQSQACTTSAGPNTLEYFSNAPVVLLSSGSDRRSPHGAGRPEMVVGWYHSHPGFGCWLSGVDVNTQQSFEALNQVPATDAHAIHWLCSSRPA